MEKKGVMIWFLFALAVSILSFSLIRFTFKHNFGAYYLPEIFTVLCLVSFFVTVILLSYLFVGKGKIVESAEKGKLFSRRGLYLGFFLFLILLFYLDFIRYTDFYALPFSLSVIVLMPIRALIVLKQGNLRLAVDLFGKCSYGLSFIIIVCIAAGIDKLRNVIKTK